MKNFITLATAIISAVALLCGYGYQKHMEREAEIRKTRQDIYSRLVASITKANEITGRLEQTPEWKEAKNAQERNQLAAKNPELSKNWHNRTEIISLLCLYGTDDAIGAYLNWTKEDLDPKGKGGDLGELVVALRKAIYPKTHTKAGEADAIIWENDTYLRKPSQAK